MTAGCGTIALRRMRFQAHHGVGAQERVVGNRFEVTLSVTCPMRQAMEHDCLDGTVNYAGLYAVVEREMRQPSQLLEHVAWRIAQAVRRQFPQVQGGTVTVTKVTPPFKCDLDGVDVTINF